MKVGKSLSKKNLSLEKSFRFTPMEPLEKQKLQNFNKNAEEKRFYLNFDLKKKEVQTFVFS